MVFVGICHEEGMAMGVFAPANELERPSFEIKHPGFLGLPYFDASPGFRAGS